MAFSVAPTLGRAKITSRPFSAPRQYRRPPRSSISPPRARMALRCRSMGRGPSSHPPGNERSASPIRPRMAPRKMTEERISRIRAWGTSQRAGAVASTVTVGVPSLGDPAAQMAQDLQGSRHIGQGRAVLSVPRGTRRQNGGSQDGKGAVLRPMDADCSAQRPSAFNDQSTHGFRPPQHWFVGFTNHPMQGRTNGETLSISASGPEGSCRSAHWRQAPPCAAGPLPWRPASPCG